MRVAEDRVLLGSGVAAGGGCVPHKKRRTDGHMQHLEAHTLITLQRAR